MRHLAQDVVQRVLGHTQAARRRRTPGPPRHKPARAAPGRTASSRNAARASRRRLSSDENRRRRDRACRRAPSPAASPRTIRAASASPVLACSRKRNSSSLGRGTSARLRIRRGARRTTGGTARRCAAARRRQATSTRRAARSPARSCSVTCSAESTTFSRSARHTRAISCRISANPGLPHFDEGGKYGAAVERLQLRRQPDAHRPPAGSGRGLHERHVDAVDVRALLAIDLDRHEVLVQYARDVVVLERLVLHHVAPVARRVADRQEDRLVLRSRLVERFARPRIPVDGIVRVLEQVRTALAREPVHPPIMTCSKIAAMRSTCRASAWRCSSKTSSRIAS